MVFHRILDFKTGLNVYSDPFFILRAVAALATTPLNHSNTGHTAILMKRRFFLSTVCALKNSDSHLY